MQKIRITEIISFIKLLLIIYRNMHVYCSDIKRDKIIGQNAALKILLESRKSIKETISNDPTVGHNIYKPGSEKVDFLIFDTLRTLKINRASVTRLQIPVHLVYQFAWMRNMCVDDCINHEVCMHFFKVFFIENRYTFSRILTDHIYRRHKRMVMDYAKYINLEKKMVRTFFKHNASRMYHIKPQKAVIKIHECKFNSEIQSTVYLMRSLYNETDGFTQFMSDANFYNKTKSKESKDLYRANVVIVYTLMNLLDLVGSSIIKKSHYQNLLALHTELKSLILEDFSNSDSKCTFFTPENCRKLHDCYLSYSAYIAEYVEYQDYKNEFIFPPFCYEYDIRWHLYSINDGSDYYKPSLESCNDGRRLYFRQYERQLYIAKLKHAIFFEYGKRLIKRLDDLFLTALSDPESPFGSSCMLILFSVIVNYY